MVERRNMRDLLFDAAMRVLRKIAEFLTHKQRILQVNDVRVLVGAVLLRSDKFTGFFS